MPDEYRPGIFGAILSSKLANLQRNGNVLPFHHHEDHEEGLFTGQHKSNHKVPHSKGHSRSNSETLNSSEPSSGRATPSKRPKWYDGDTHSTESMATLLAQASLTSTAAAAPGTSGYVPRLHQPRPKTSNSMIATAVDMIKHPGNVSEARIDVATQVSS